MNTENFCAVKKLGRFRLNLTIFGHSCPISTIYMLFGLSMKNDVVSEQYFLYGQTDNILFEMPGDFQEVIGIFGENIIV